MRWMALLLLTIVLAGCTDAPEETPDDVTFDGLSATDTTGVIRGVVVNDAIEPVQGATVIVTGLELSDETDEQGRFTFSDLEPGTYFLDVSKDLHVAVQSNVEVVAGVDSPPILKVQLNRLYTGDPYLVTVAMDGFFTCSQAGTIVWGYTSSPCHSIGWGTNIDTCDDADVCLDQERVFHTDLDAGWQTLIFEMDWEPTAQGTSDQLGMSVSTFHPERNKNHWFASVSSQAPMHFEIATGDMHSTAQEGDGPMGPIPADGMTDMSMYMSVREPVDCPAGYCPGFAIDQKFQAWHSQFYYQAAPEGWSFRNGDVSPF